ncbi:MAG: hypothetical protein ACSHXW_05955 [Yoonia sp.]
MAYYIRILAGLFVLAPLAAMFSEPFFEALFDILDWDTESFAAPALAFAQNMVSHDYFWNVSIGLTAVGFGVWLHYLATRYDGSVPSKAMRFQSLYSLIESVTDEWFNSFRTAGGGHDFDKTNYPAELRRKVLYAELVKVGIKPPDFTDLDNLTANIGHYSFMKCLGPFAALGQLKEAKREAKSTVAQIRAHS